MMKALTINILICLTLAFCPALALAASDGHDHGGHDQGAKKESSHAGHDGMSTDGSMIIVGSQTSKGVKGMAHIKDVSAAMAKMGMKTTHHFMMAFVDEATGEQIENGTVALKITNPDAKVGETIELIGMDGHFGADVVLDMQGEYHFRLGTKLEDDKKRKYHFHYVNK